MVIYCRTPHLAHAKYSYAAYSLLDMHPLIRITLFEPFAEWQTQILLH